MDNNLNKLALISFAVPITMLSVLLVMFYLRSPEEVVVPLLLGFTVVALIDIVIGIVAFRKMRRNGERGMSYIITGWILTIPYVAFISYVVVGLMSVGHMP